MKRILPLLIVLLLFSLLLAACSGGDSGNKPLPAGEELVKTAEGEEDGEDIYKPLPAGEELVKTLTDAGIFDDELEAVDPVIAALLYGFTEEDGIELHSWLSSSGGTAEEFSLIVCPDDAALAAAKQSAEARLENQKRTYESYAPNEVPKLEGAVVRVRDNVLVVCVAADPKKAAELLAPYFRA